jgi:hypothetical protein
MSLTIENYPNFLIQTDIFKPYSHEDFNNKRHIDDCCDQALENSVEYIGNLLKKYNLDNILGMCRVHNHFKLNENELVQTDFIKYKNHSQKGDERNISYLKVIKPDSSCNLKCLPYMWAYDRHTKRLVAFQFFNRDFKLIEDCLENLSNQSQDLVRFYEEFSKYVEESNMYDYIGIYLLYNKFFEVNPEVEGLLEETDEETREQWIFPIKLSKLRDMDKKCKITTTLWDFSEGSLNTLCEH